MKILFLILCLLTPAWSAPADPATVVQSFTNALKKRDLKAATALCDVSVNYFEPYGTMDGSEYPVKPAALMQAIAARVTDAWITEGNPDKIRVASEGRAYEPKYFFKGDKTYFAVADGGVSREEWQTFGDNEKLDVRAAKGFVVFLHQVNGKWLIYKLVENAVIANPRT